MKSTLFFSLITISALFGPMANIEACGPNGGRNGTTSNYPGNHPYGTSPYGAGSSVFAPVGSPFAAPLPNGRLTVLPATGNIIGTSTPSSSESTATGSIHVISAVEKVEAPKTTPKVEPVVNKAVDLSASTKEESAIAEGLKSLVGTWKAVGRHGDGELSTIELQLDNRGWAKLTVPGADGKPSTITRRVELENDKEIKLTSADGALALGKLVEFNDRQLVLDRPGGQVTFVRP